MSTVRRALAYDMRGLLACSTLGSVFVYSFVLLLVAGAEAQMPPWMVAVASLVAGHYFGHRESAGREDAYTQVISDLTARVAADVPAAAVVVPVRELGEA